MEIKDVLNTRNWELGVVRMLVAFLCYVYADLGGKMAKETT